MQQEMSFQISVLGCFRWFFTILIMLHFPLQSFHLNPVVYTPWANSKRVNEDLRKDLGLTTGGKDRKWKEGKEIMADGVYHQCVCQELSELPWTRSPRHFFLPGEAKRVPWNSSRYSELRRRRFNQRSSRNPTPIYIFSQSLIVDCCVMPCTSTGSVTTSINFFKFFVKVLPRVFALNSKEHTAIWLQPMAKNTSFKQSLQESLMIREDSAEGLPRFLRLLRYLLQPMASLSSGRCCSACFQKRSNGHFGKVRVWDFLYIIGWWFS